jgi:hypothetical protein
MMPRVEHAATSPLVSSLSASLSFPAQTLQRRVLPSLRRSRFVRLSQSFHGGRGGERKKSTSPGLFPTVRGKARVSKKGRDRNKLCPFGNLCWFGRCGGKRGNRKGSGGSSELKLFNFVPPEEWRLKRGVTGKWENHGRSAGEALKGQYE